MLAHLQPDLVPDGRRGETAPGGLAPPGRRGRVGNVVSDHRVHTVSADEQGPGRLAPVGELDRDLPSVLLDGHATGVERDVLIANSGAQRIVKIGPVHVVEGRPPSARCGRGKGHSGEDGATVPVALVPRQ